MPSRSNQSAIFFINNNGMLGQLMMQKYLARNKLLAKLLSGLCWIPVKIKSAAVQSKCNSAIGTRFYLINLQLFCFF